MCRNFEKTLAPPSPLGHRAQMPRPPRDTEAGIFHVYTHCVWASPALYRDEIDRMFFVRELARVTVTIGWTCIAFCEMGTHYHLLLEVERGMLPRGMQSLNFRYALNYNQRHALKGHVQFERYGSRRIRTEADLVTTYKYIVTNPSEAGLCEHPADWLWSGYAGTVGLAPPHSFVDATRVFRCFDGAPELAIAKLRAFEGL